jgi:hypothetical protein
MLAMVPVVAEGEEHHLLAAAEEVHLSGVAQALSSRAASRSAIRVAGQASRKGGMKRGKSAKA